MNAINLKPKNSMLKSINFFVSVAVLLSVSSFARANSQQTYDLVINNGRVIDPETQLDAVRSVGINAGEIVAVSKSSLRGKQSIDAKGMVVAPGFIDIHSHTPTLLGQYLNLLDGITTQLDLEAGSFPVDYYGESFRGGAQLNYGSSVSHMAIRTKVIEGLDKPYILHGNQPEKLGTAVFVQRATAAQIEQMRVLVNQGLEQGGLGIGVLLDYMTSAVSDGELAMLFDVAAKREVPITVHVRRGIDGDPAGLQEVIELAKSSGAALLVCHITHNAISGIDNWLAMIDQANEGGANITTEMLSYGAGGTSIGADVFARRDWQTIFNITYEDVQWVATGEWLTKETWDKYMAEQPGGMINHHYLKEEWVIKGLKWPRMMISTDALPAVDLDILTNPNVAGTFSRVLGRYVREQQVLSLSDALAKLSLYQAQWLEQASDVFKKKGRLQVGSHADIVVFDPVTISANADYGKPYEPPTGLHHVIVGGRHIVKNGERLEGRYPGKKILGNLAN